MMNESGQALMPCHIPPHAMKLWTAEIAGAQRSPAPRGQGGLDSHLAPFLDPAPIQPGPVLVVHHAPGFGGNERTPPLAGSFRCKIDCGTEDVQPMLRVGAVGRFSIADKILIAARLERFILITDPRIKIPHGAARKPDVRFEKVHEIQFDFFESGMTGIE